MNQCSVQGLNIVVLVSGRGTNLQAIIDAQSNQQIKSQIKKVVANKSGIQALDRCRSAKIPFHVIPSKGKTDDEFQDELLQYVAALSPDLIVLAGFMRILHSDFVRTFENRIVNIHPSLLPAFPGLHAVRQALEAGVKVTGCTVHFVDAACDTGPVILQTPVNIQDEDTEATLAERLLKIEHKTLIQAIKLLENNKVILQGRKTLLRDKL